MHKLYKLIHFPNKSENIYYILLKNPNDTKEINILQSKLKLSDKSTLSPDNIFEFGPKIGVRSPWSSNAENILTQNGFENIILIELGFQTTDRNLFYKKYDQMVHQIYTDQEVFHFPKQIIKRYSDWESKTIPFDKFDEYNQKNGLAMDSDDIKFYLSYFKDKLGREPTETEFYDLGQSNSEHSRHWFFNSEITIDNQKLPKSLFEMVKEPYLANPGISLIAFHDNSSAIKGYETNVLPVDHGTRKATKTQKILHFVLTAETHNFPTGICPFQGAGTGTGGRIRDVIATGQGAQMIAGSAGYCVANLQLPKSIHILIDASNGASDYGNKIGEPIIMGFTRSYGLGKIRWDKPIMFTSGLGTISNDNLAKDKPVEGDLVVRVGGPTYRIGIGGGSASSRSQTSLTDDLSAVQRGDPEMECRVVRFIEAILDLESNPIRSIHDQGAGGMANVTKEIVSPLGAKISLDKVNLGDPSLSPMETWTAESQEQITILITPTSLVQVEEIAKREHVPIEVIGQCCDTGKIEVSATVNGKTQTILDLDLEDVLENVPIKKKKVNSEPLLHSYSVPDTIPEHDFGVRFVNPSPGNYIYEVSYELEQYASKVFSNLDVGSKRFLTNKVDRSVSGLIAQQQCIGESQLPVANYGLISSSYFPNQDGKFTGCVSAIGERPYVGFDQVEKQVRMTVGEMLTNMIWCCVSDLKDVRCSGNWMWPVKVPGYDHKLVKGVQTLKDTCLSLGIAIDGGKDSLSMTSLDKETGDQLISPPQLVLTGYAPCPNLDDRVNPYGWKTWENHFLFIDLGCGKNRLGGSIFAQEVLKEKKIDCEKLEAPDFDQKILDVFPQLFTWIQDNIRRKNIIAGHDRSDGGLLGCVHELSGEQGFVLEVPWKFHNQHLEYLFNEELGLVLVVEEEETAKKLITDFHRQTDLINAGLDLTEIGYTTAIHDLTYVYSNNPDDPDLNMIYYMSKDNSVFRQAWNKTSFQLEFEQSNKSTVESEENIVLSKWNTFYATIDQDMVSQLETIQRSISGPAVTYKPGVAILREEGSNGHREMRAAFETVGFQVYDLNLDDLESGFNLSIIKGIVFVGGFSYSDVFGAGVGWSWKLEKPKAKEKLEEFRKREDTFSLGICNGCQLMSHLDWIGTRYEMDENDSGRFESRWSYLRIHPETPSIFFQTLKKFETPVFGIWSAHHQGKFIMRDLSYQNHVPVSFCDPNWEDTQTYPYNPNGSLNGIAGLSSADGRHLVMMPHPERSFLKYQIPDGTMDHYQDCYLAPWTLMFYDAYKWCCET